MRFVRGGCHLRQKPSNDASFAGRDRTNATGGTDVKSRRTSTRVYSPPRLLRVTDGCGEDARALAGLARRAPRACPSCEELACRTAEDDEVDDRQHHNSTRHNKIPV